MKKILALLLALTLALSLAACGSKTATESTAPDTSAAPAAEAKNVVILVPNADHGWTGAVMTYAQEKAEEITAAGTYNAKVITSTDPQTRFLRWKTSSRTSPRTRSSFSRRTTRWKPL